MSGLRERIDSVLAGIDGTILAGGELAGLLAECGQALATPPAAPDEAMLRDADMFWNDSDTEQAAYSIDEIVSNAYENGAEHGQVIEIQQAARLPNVSVRFVMHESGDYGYEVIDAALTGDKA